MKHITFFLFLLASALLPAQSLTVSGKVVDSTQKPLVGATIIVKQLNKGTSTAIDGHFSLKLPKGEYTADISYLGYQTKSIKISDNSENIMIVLIPEEAILDEVLVSSVRAKKGAPVTFSNITKAELEKRNLGQDIPILLNYLPSVITSSDAGAGIGYTYMRVRGSDASRINVTVNGIPYNDAESQGTFWVNMGDFASSTQSIQLQRGVGTSTNGSGAFGASLNILTDAVSENAGGEIANSFGSYGTRKHTVKFTTGKLNEHFELSGRLSNIYSNGYVDRAFTDLKSYFLQGSYTDRNTLVKALVFGGTEQTYQAWFGLTAQQLVEDRRQNPYTYDNETDNYQQDHYQLHWNEKISDQVSTTVGLNYTRGKGYFEQFKDDESASNFDNLITDGSDVIVRRWLDNHFYVFNASGTYTTNNLELILGGSYSNYSNDHYGEVIWGSNLAQNTTIRDQYYFSDAKKHDLSSFVKANLSLTNQLKAYVDLQGRYVSYRTQGLTSERNPLHVNTTFNFFNPKVGITYTPNEHHNLYASYAKANREPNRNDFETGTTQHESLDDYEMGWRFTSEHIKVNTNIYYMDYTNQLVLTGAINDVGEPIRGTSGKSYRTGLEIDADINISKQLTIKPNMAWSMNRNQDFNTSLNGNIVNLGDTPISFSPDIIIGNSLIYKPLNNLQLAFLSKYVSEQFMGNLGGVISDNEILEAYFTSDLNIVYEMDVTSVFKSIVFTGLINNVFNKEYVDRGYYYFYDYDVEDSSGNVIGQATGDGAGYYPQATRNFLVGVTLKF